jgi:hypothetical protein
VKELFEVNWRKPDDLLNCKVLLTFAEQGMSVIRIFTDRGTEYCGKPRMYYYQFYSALNAIEHTYDRPHRFVSTTRTNQNEGPLALNLLRRNMPALFGNHVVVINKNQFWLECFAFLIT